MKYIIKKSEARVVKEENSQFFEYQFPFDNFSVGASEISGRYPTTDFSVDESVDAYWYVESGRGRICIAGEEHTIEQGDMITVPKGEKYWINGEQLRLVVCGSPVWYPEQHKHQK